MGAATRTRAVPDAAGQARPEGRDELLSPRGRFWLVAATLILVDVLLLLGNVAWLGSNEPGEPVTLFSGPAWNGDMDGTFIEIWGHIQLIATVVTLVVLALARRSWTYAAWALTVALIMVDDFAELHETLGGRLVVALGLPGVLGLRPQDLGELSVWAAESVVAGIIVLATLPRASRIARHDSLVILGCIVVLAIFGVGVDQLDIIVSPHLPHLGIVALVLTETAGELGGMTLIAVAVHGMTLPRSSLLRRLERPRGPART